MDRRKNILNLMDNYLIGKKVLKNLEPKDLKNMFIAGINTDQVENEIFSRYDNGDRDQKAEFVILFPKTFLVEFGIENLSLEEMEQLKGKLDEDMLTVDQLKNLVTFKDCEISLDRVKGEDVYYSELERRFSLEIENENLEQQFEIFEMEPDFIKDNFNLVFLISFFPKIIKEDLEEFHREAEEGYEDEFEFFDETLEERNLYRRFKYLVKNNPEIWEYIPTPVKYNRQFIKDYEFWDWLSGENFYEGFLYSIIQE